MLASRLCSNEKILNFFTTNANRIFIRNKSLFHHLKFNNAVFQPNWSFIRSQVTVPIAKVATQKPVGIWLTICSGMVYLAVAIGGYTRLTESGLSMVTWKFAYEKYPSSEDEWENEFKKYQEYPEYKQLKKDITLSEFKNIWLTEYFHRNWGRFLGLSFFIPAGLFWMKGYLSPFLKKRISVFGLLIGAQGLMGWYMVKSGLEDRFHKDTEIPRVSQYRLATHLGLALTLYTGLLWTALELLLPTQKIVSHSNIKTLKILSHTCKGMVFLTALSGAFVAGLDAGLVYNSFPKMGDKWIPDDVLDLSPWYKNFTENPTAVQLDHRILGISTFSLIMITKLISRKYHLPKTAKWAVNSLTLMAILQVLMGISTLVHYVPTSQAVAHQSGSTTLLTTAIWFAHEMKKLKYVPK
ncbi:cytochrome C oxidase assembly protein cox15, putative [Pediculus humanus corporis]|uniref:Cytochrome C oxidase assembly protein cox15, putative n=1 Tax=Pediculus humanus subsp. corporis TaxID=121224 RepID=E0VSM3_PEDHC|nr:cytochrome C oxidase assembly protein cox15, putative [Pediculus humanus corporis]EEB16379.1 cytochrome C oxidase assembly protein cox15, putative [Pediculus humanus corporis]